MANYYGKTRTNYFKVNDPEAFKELLEKCAGTEDPLKVWAKEEDGFYAFGCESEVAGIDINKDPDDPEYDYDAFLEALQKCVLPGDAVIITSVGWEKLRYLGADAVIITAKDIEYMSLESAAIKKARELLGNPDWTTDNCY